jgi:hypothetical protein
MSSPFDGIDWDHYMATFPKTHEVAPTVDPLLKKAIGRASMLLFLNELKPTKSAKKLAELEKSALLVKKFMQ